MMSQEKPVLESHFSYMFRFAEATCIIYLPGRELNSGYTFCLFCFLSFFPSSTWAVWIACLVSILMAPDKNKYFR